MKKQPKITKFNKMCEIDLINAAWNDLCSSSNFDAMSDDIKEIIAASFIEAVIKEVK